jgi:L-amino acid N-acyltransferase YncA
MSAAVAQHSPQPASPPTRKEELWHVAPAGEKDWPGIWAIFREVIATGDTFAYAPQTTEMEAHDLWMQRGTHGTGAAPYVVREGEEIVGTFTLRPNHHGLGSHVANAGYMVKASHRGRGIARAMCRFSLEEARRQGYLSMQFNYVVSTNTKAVELWQAMGFKIIGIAPKSYRHAQFGLVDIYIMHRFLDGVQDA